MIFGIDISSTSTGFVALDTNGEIMSALALAPKGTVIERGLFMAQKIAEFVKGNDPDRIVIEDYGFASHKLTPQAEAKGIILAVIYQLGYGWTLVAPQQLKKFVGGQQKEDVRLQTYKRWGFEHKSNDVVDAYVLAQIGRALNHLTADLTKAQQEVIDKIRAK